MALSRTAVLLLLLPAPAVVYLTASLEDVSASSQCLPSADAVRQQYPGAWASWTTRAPDHKGERCWFPAMRENHAHHIEAVLRRTAQTLMRREAQRQSPEPAGSEKTPEWTPVAFAAEMTGLGWAFRARSTQVSAAKAADEVATKPSSFDDRFAAARDVTSVNRPSVIQRMMDPVGAIP